MTGLYVLLWVYALVAVAAVGGCLWSMWAGLATGRHRRPRRPVLSTFCRDVAEGLWNGAELILYGRVP